MAGSIPSAASTAASWDVWPDCHGIRATPCVRQYSAHRALTRPSSGASLTISRRRKLHFANERQTEQEISQELTIDPFSFSIGFFSLFTVWLAHLLGISFDLTLSSWVPESPSGPAERTVTRSFSILISNGLPQGSRNSPEEDSSSSCSSRKNDPLRIPSRKRFNNLYIVLSWDLLKVPPKLI